MATKKKRFRIVDTAALSAVVEELIDAKGKKGPEKPNRPPPRATEVVAARRIGIGQPLLNRLRRGKRKRMSEATARALATAAARVSRELAERFTAAMLSPEGVQQLNSYEDWMRRRVRSGGAAGAAMRLMFQVELHHSDLLEPLRRELRKLLVEVDADADAFVDWDARFQLALLHIIEPLAHATFSHGIERRWEELTEKERESFIKLGVRREVILLRGRKSDEQRAAEAAEKARRRRAR